MEDTRDFWQQANETSFPGGPDEGAAGRGADGSFGWQEPSLFGQTPAEGTGSGLSSVAFEGEQIPLGEGEDIWSLGGDSISWPQQESDPYGTPTGEDTGTQSSLFGDMAPAEEPVQEQFNPSLLGDTAPAEEPVQEQFNPSLLGDMAPAEEPAQEQFNPSLLGDTAPAEEPVQEQFNPSLLGDTAPAEEPVQEQFNPSLFGDAAPAEEMVQEQFNPSLFGDTAPAEEAPAAAAGWPEVAPVEEDPAEEAAPAPAPETREQPKEEELPPDPNFDPFAAVSGGQKLNAGPFVAKVKKKPFGGSAVTAPAPAAEPQPPVEAAVPAAPVEKTPAAPAAWPGAAPVEEAPAAPAKTPAPAAAAPAPAPETREQPKEEELPPDPNFDPFAAVSGGQKLNAGPFVAKVKKKPFGGSAMTAPAPAAESQPPVETAAPAAPAEEAPAAPVAAWPEVAPVEEAPAVRPETPASTAAAPAPAPETREQPKEEELPPDPNFDPFAAVSGGQKLNAGPFVAKVKKKPFGGSAVTEPAPAAEPQPPVEAAAPAAPVEKAPAAPVAAWPEVAPAKEPPAAPAKTPAPAAAAPAAASQTREQSGEGELPPDPNFDPFAMSFSNSLSFKARVKKESFAGQTKKNPFGEASHGAGTTSVWGTQPAREQPAPAEEKKSGSGWPFAGEAGSASSPWTRKPKTEPRNTGGSASPWGQQSGASTASFWGKKEAPRSPASVVCPRCGTENPAEASFCCMCRSPLKERTCPTCGRVVPVAQAKFCPFCGGDL